MIRVIKAEVPNESVRRGIYHVLITSLQEADWDTEDEATGIDPAFDLALHGINGPDDDLDDEEDEVAAENFMDDLRSMEAREDRTILFEITQENKTRYFMHLYDNRTMVDVLDEGRKQVVKSILKEGVEV